MIRQIYSFLKKDFITESSYKFSCLTNIFAVFASLLSFYFIDKLFGQKMVAHLEEFGVNYFSYVLLSMAVFSYIGAGLGSFSGRLHLEQLQGTLEAILLSPIKKITLLLSMVLWNVLFATLDLSVYIALGIFLFKISFSNANIPAALLTLILIILSFSSLGILSASFTLIFKRGNPIGWMMNSLEGLVGGVYFPIGVLPFWLKFLAGILPISYAVRATELSVYRGYGIMQLKKELGFLLLFSLILVPLSLAAFNYALKKAKSGGNLSQY